MADFKPSENLDQLNDEQIEVWAGRTRDERMKWWHDARFGMFIHWGLYSVLGRHEWAMNRERIPVAEYEKLADQFKPDPKPMREWAKLAVDSGMKYMVLTTKHHEGFCLWDTKQTDYNAVQRGPKRDLVAEYVETCREFGLKIGLYYSLMDWHHPDGFNCVNDEDARRRFIDFTYGCVEELMSNYGEIDILWYDVPAPLKEADSWESRRRNAMARRLQPHLLINNRSVVEEDFGTPEQHIKSVEGRPWEACMTTNPSWGYFPAAPESDWKNTRDIIHMLHRCAALGGGNLLLNVGPAPDGSLPELAHRYFEPVGRWLDKHGEAVLGNMDPTADRVEWANFGPGWTLSGNSAYLLNGRWASGEFAIGGFETKLNAATLLTTGEPIDFQQEDDRILLRGMPETCPDEIAEIAVIRLDFAEPPQQLLGPCMIPMPW